MHFAGKCTCPAGEHIKEENIPDWLKPNATYVKRHYLRFCKGLRRIPTDIPHDVLQVKIYGNPLTTLRAQSFNKLPECTKIFLGFNEISDIEAHSFSGLTSVQQVYLNDNKLTHLRTGMFFGLPNCKILKLHFNEIDSIEYGSFGELDNLEILDFFDNKLTQLNQGMFTGLPSLKQLSLRKNSLQTVHTGSLSGLPLTHLLLDSNNLETLSWTMFVTDEAEGNLYHPTALQLELTSNRLHCNALLCWVKNAEEEGWLDWVREVAPQCSDRPGVPWSSIDLKCVTPGQCNSFSLDISNIK